MISPDLHSGDRLRARIALSADGNRLALGFPSAGSADDFGMVVIHHRTSSGWVLEQSFIPDFVRPGEIGGILGINATGDTLLMGKYEGGTKLQILHRTGTTWSLVKEIQAAQSTDPSTVSIECANARLSANGLTIARTCMLYENFNEDGKPSIEVFAAPSWTRRNVIAMSALAHQSRLGDLSMDACGDTLAIAASLPDTPPHVTPIVAIYHRAEGEYSRMATLLPHWWSSNPAETRASQFGAVLELNRDGTLLAIGDSADSTAGEGVLSAPFAGASTNLRGAVYVYERSGTSWRLRRLVKPNSTPGVFNVNTYDGFGAALSLGDNGRTLIVGHGNESSYVSNSASQQPTKSGANSGAVWLY